MPAKNIYHDAVVSALEAEGWSITNDPLTLRVGDRDLYVDLAAERYTDGIERIAIRIAVEIQSFLGQSVVNDLHSAIGQYMNYRSVLNRQHPGRTLYLAVTKETNDGILSEPLGRMTVADSHLNLIVFDPDTRKVIEWKK